MTKIGKKILNPNIDINGLNKEKDLKLEYKEQREANLNKPENKNQSDTEAKKKQCNIYW